MDINMEKIMEASFGEVSNVIKATYKKTINVKQYESEVIELETTLDMGDKKLTGVERMLISAMLQAQLEYTAYCNLTYKGIVTTTELAQRKAQLIDSVQALKGKAETILKRSMDEYFEEKGLAVTT